MKLKGMSMKKQNHFVVGIVLLLMGTSAALVQYKIPSIMPWVRELFAMSATEASWLMSIFTFVGIFIALPTGGLAQRIGAKKVIFIGSGAVVLGSLLGAFAGSAPVLIVSRAIEGIALTIITTCGPILVQRTVSPDRIGTAMGIFGIWGSMGAVVAGVLTPLLFEAAGYRGVWFIYAGFAAVAALLLLVFVRDPDSHTKASLKPESLEVRAGSDDILSKESKPHYRELLTKDLLLFFASFICVNLILLAILSYMPSILQMQGFNPALSGFVSTLPMLLGLVSAPAFGMLSDKLGRRKPLILLTLVVTGPCALLLYTNTGVVMWIAAIVMGLLGMAGTGLFLAAYVKLIPRAELVPAGMGLLVLLQGVGQFLGSYLAQMLLGPDLTNWFFAGAWLLVIGLLGSLTMALCRLR
jgi:MFS family permease